MIRAEQINLDGRDVIRVRQDGCLIGYFTDPVQIEAALVTQGRTLADITITPKGSTP